jgi:hypoxanthine-guanine phosphoribosyltransferase
MESLELHRKAKALFSEIVPIVVKGVLVDSEEVEKGQEKISYRIVSDVKDSGFKKVHIVCLLKGGQYFLDDLLRNHALDEKLRDSIPGIEIIYDSFGVRRYNSIQGSVVEVYKLPDVPLRPDEFVPIPEDVIDEGTTVAYVRHLFRNIYGVPPENIRIYFEVNKNVKRKVEPSQLPGEIVACVNIGDEWVVNRGLDLDEMLRYFPPGHIFYVRKDVVLGGAEIDERFDKETQEIRKAYRRLFSEFDNLGEVRHGGQYIVNQHRYHLEEESGLWVPVFD